MLKPHHNRSLASVCKAIASLGVLLCLAGCPPVLIPSVSRDVETERMVEMKLMNLDANEELHLLKKCQLSSKATVEGCSGPRDVSFLVRPVGWSAKKVALQDPSKIAKLTEGRFGFSLRSHLSGVNGFGRPAFAKQNAPDTFVGYFVDAYGWTSLVWLGKDALFPDESDSKPSFPERQFLHVTLPKKNANASPALVLQEGGQVWLFVDAGDQCLSEQCFAVDEVLQARVDPVPERFRNRRFELYFARDLRYEAKEVTTKNFDAVVKARTGTASERSLLIGQIPKPKGDFAFDDRVIPASRFSDASPSVACEWVSYAAGTVVMLTAENRVKSTMKLSGCTVLEPSVPWTLEAR
ncbi:hypothetical protein CLU95_1566 [Variovorax sp. 54]|uniref:hypothetical protein n=1 Tax=Variovorax sp. 54 TaxID=2035212 RepID=UPI000C47A1E4|nr:hypothetical protein [Variovorax sp. 54]PIF74439.1 hypothetical protein CLU95_1566 [Variovorax sp. 54]